MNSTLEVRREPVAPVCRGDVSNIHFSHRMQMRRMKVILGKAQDELECIADEALQERLYALLECCDLLADKEIAEAAEAEGALRGVH